MADAAVPADLQNATPEVRSDVDVKVVPSVLDTPAAFILIVLHLPLIERDLIDKLAELVGVLGAHGTLRFFKDVLQDSPPLQTTILLSNSAGFHKCY